MPTYTPDLSGLDWEYHVTTYQRTVFRNSQKLLFDIPIHQNERLEVIRLGTVNVPMVAGEDWVVQENDIDYDAISVCKNIDPEFNGILLKSITIIQYYIEEYKVQVKFNQLFADQLSYAAINRDRTIEVTPALIGNILEQVDYLQQMVLNPSGLYSPQSVVIKILEEDRNGENIDHWIEDELHDVDTINGIKFIRPIYGAFFKDSLVIKNSLNDEVLVADTDYRVVEVDYAKTGNTSNTSGVYRTVEILKPLVGELKLSYWAYGGTADISSLQKLHERLQTLEDYLSKTSHVTPHTLPSDPAIISIRNKVNELEGYMRLLLQNGLPNYGDVSTDTAVLKKVTSPDTLIHWWTISTLYRVDGSNDNVLADVFKFRLKSLLTGMMFECSVSVNVSGLGQRLTVSCDNSNLPKDTLARLTPKLRILEATTGGIYSGIVLQLGMKLGSGVLQETFAIEDMSGRESCWKLVEFDAESTPPEDTTVLMPNGSATWTTSDPDSKVDVATIPFTEGLVVTTLNANIPLIVNNNVVEVDQITQSVGEIGLNKCKGLSHLVTVDIGGAAYDIRVVTPITMMDEGNKLYTFKGILTLNDGADSYELKVVLSNPETNYQLAYYLGRWEGSGVSTFNVTESRLMF